MREGPPPFPREYRCGRQTSFGHYLGEDKDKFRENPPGDEFLANVFHFPVFPPFLRLLLLSRPLSSLCFSIPLLLYSFVCLLLSLGIFYLLLSLRIFYLLLSLSLFLCDLLLTRLLTSPSAFPYACTHLCFFIYIPFPRSLPYFSGFY